MGPGYRNTQLYLYGVLAAPQQCMSVSDQFSTPPISHTPDRSVGEYGTYVGTHPKKGYDIILQFRDYYCETIRVRRAIAI